MVASPFIVNFSYKRSGIHDEFGGNRQGGISTSARFPYIFIFSGKSGTLYGYKDGWDNYNMFTYTGEGQTGDMTFIKGNIALRDHIRNGKRVFLFETIPGRRSFVKFISELEFFDADYFEAPDKSGTLRKAIRFFFKRQGAEIPVTANELELTYGNHLPIEDNKYIPPDRTERAGLVLTRVGHGAYRKRIIHRWNYQCAVTGFNRLDALIASQIVPWAESNDFERLDVNNGILMSPTYDALFDRHLISFDNNGKILLSAAVESTAFRRISVSGTEVIKNLCSENKSYLDRHRALLK